MTNAQNKGAASAAPKLRRQPLTTAEREARVLGWKAGLEATIERLKIKGLWNPYAETIVEPRDG